MKDEHVSKLLKDISGIYFNTLHGENFDAEYKEICGGRKFNIPVFYELNLGFNRFTIKPATFQELEDNSTHFLSLLERTNGQAPFFVGNFRCDGNNLHGKLSMPKFDLVPNLKEAWMIKQGTGNMVDNSYFPGRKPFEEHSLYSFVNTFYNFLHEQKFEASEPIHSFGEIELLKKL